MSDTDILREASTRMLALAEAATPGPWRTHDAYLDIGGHTATVLSGEGNATDLRAWLPTRRRDVFWDETRNVWNDAAHIAAWHPAVAVAVGGWLGCVAIDEHWEPESAARIRERTAALIVARAFLGEVAS